MKNSFPVETIEKGIKVKYIGNGEIYEVKDITSDHVTLFNDKTEILTIADGFYHYFKPIKDEGSRSRAPSTSSSPHEEHR